MNNIIKTTKISYYKEKIQNTRNNPEVFWKTINELAGMKDKKYSFPLDQFIAGNQRFLNVDGRKDVAKDFNNYFSQVGSNLADALNPTGPMVIDDSNFSIDSEFSLNTITEEELATYVGDLRGGSAPSYDNGSADFLKINFKVLSRPLLYIINKSIRTGEFQCL